MAHDRDLVFQGIRAPGRRLHRSSLDLLNPGWLSFLAALGLSVLGIMSIETIDSVESSRQVAILCGSVMCAALLMIPHYRWLERLAFPMMFLTLVLLVLVLLPMLPEWLVRPRHGARRWIGLGSGFQPSELAKVTYIIALAAYLRNHRNYRRIVTLLFLGFLTGIPMVLILLEPDLGTALLFPPTLLAMIIVTGIRIRVRHLLVLLLVCLACGRGVYPHLKPHQQDRLVAYFHQVMNDDRHQLDIGYQGRQAMTLVGAGGVSGLGRQQASSMVRFNRLPEAHNDMIFAVIICRWGLKGGLIVWGLFLLFCLGGFLAAGQRKDPFARLLVVGIISMLFVQMVINSGMTIGLFPITGLTLPFISHGGSSLLTTWLMVGLLLNVALRRPRFMARETFSTSEEN